MAPRSLLNQPVTVRSLMVVVAMVALNLAAWRLTEPLHPVFTDHIAGVDVTTYSDGSVWESGMPPTPPFRTHPPTVSGLVRTWGPIAFSGTVTLAAIAYAAVRSAREPTVSRAG